MKEFPSPNPKWVPKTMTVRELIEHLSGYPADLPVFAEWESCNGFIVPENFDVLPVRKGVPPEEVRALVIDVNEY